MAQDTIGTSGHVTIEIIKPDNKIENQDGPNTISSELKNQIAHALAVNISNFGVMESAFDNDDFSSAPTGESGIYIEDSNNNLYQMKTTLESSTSTSMTLKGQARASQSYTITDAFLGNSYQSGSPDNFVTEYSAYDFNPDISLADGDQLNVTWVITISDS